MQATSGISLQLQQAAQMLRSGAVAAALELLSRLERSHPDNADVLRMHGIVLSRCNRDGEAEKRLRRVSELLPDSRAAASDHANVLLNLNQADGALAALTRQPAWSQDLPAGAESASYLFNLARAYKTGGHPEQAVAPLQQVLEWQPQHYGALLTLADVHKALGNISEAAGLFRQAIAVNPQEGTAWWSLSNLKAGQFSDEEFRQLARHADAGSNSHQQVFFEFAMATAHDQRGQLDQAFTHYAEGNRLKRKLEPWDRLGFSRWLDQLREAMHDIQLPQRPAPLGQPRPVFLVSLPRSGSTLTEQILAAHSQVTAASELPWLPRLMAAEVRTRKAGVADWVAGLSPDAWRKLGRDYLTHCKEWYADTPVFTDKLPGNFPYVGMILAMLPEALVVNVRREAMDVCWSCYRQLFISGSSFAYDFKDLAAYWHDHQQYMDYWQQRAPERVLNLDYENLVTQPEEETRRLLDFLELPFEPACLQSHRADRAVNTASAAQVRETINTRGLGHWQRYSAYLQELQQAVQSYSKTGNSVQ